jgi:hypothetical protein
MYSTGLGEDMKEHAVAVLDQFARDLQVDPHRDLTPKAMRKPGFIYFATCDRDNFPIKIGFAVDVDARLASLQCALPYQLIILATMPGMISDELALHIGFSQYRLLGEWFERSQELMDYIGKIKHAVRVSQWRREHLRVVEP